MDYITIRNLKVFAHHGVLEEETRNGQDFYVNAKLYLDTTNAAVTDDLTKSVHYGEVCEWITKFMQENTYQLIESVAHNTVLAVLNRFPLLRGMELEICKPNAPIPLPFENVSVTIKRMWHKAYVAFGSNMGEKEKFILDAIEKIGKNEECRVKKVSSFIATKPYGGVEQEDFINGVMEIETLLTPQKLLVLLNEIEAQAGRERIVHWGPRTLDLDIIFYDKEIIDTDKLQIPHADMHNRDFVLAPLNEIAPSYRHPLIGKTVRELYEDLKKQ